MTTVAAPNPPKSESQSRFSLNLTPGQQARLRQAVTTEGRTYDPAARMLRTPFASPGYHTTLKGGDVHQTRQSLMYAVALLDTGEPEHFERALGIFDTILDLQDRDPASRTYGIWSWFLEEPLAQMAPPDWNWADFCGAQLLEAVLTWRHRLPAALVKRMDEAIVHAARSIERRNVNPDYTNIAIMGAFVTLAAAESYDIADLKDYAMYRLRRFFDYTRHHGSFTEFNSPNYTIVALTELQRLRRYAVDPEARVMIDELYYLAWREITSHFHAPTRQWAGPHSRSYQTFLPPSVSALLNRATDARYPAEQVEPSIDEHRLQHDCPPDLEDSLFNLGGTHTVRSVFLKGTPDLAGTSHMAPAFTLGSINYGDLWNQRRSLQAYWGTESAPQSLRLRFLREGYDFAAAMFFSVQREGSLLAGVNFATDGGNTHVCLDPVIDATIKVRDLRLRFEFEGSDVAKPITAPKNLESLIELDFGSAHLGLQAGFAKWGERNARWESGGEGGKAWLDLVLYSGKETEFRLDSLNAAAITFALRLSDKAAPFPKLSTSHEGDSLKLAWDGLHLAIASKPATIEALRGSFA